MSDKYERVDKILQTAANDVNIPIETAQLLLRIGAVLADHETSIKELETQMQRAKQRHDEHVAKLRREIDGLKGVHGA